MLERACGAVTIQSRHHVVLGLGDRGVAEGHEEDRDTVGWDHLGGARLGGSLAHDVDGDGETVEMRDGRGFKLLAGLYKRLGARRAAKS